MATCFRARCTWDGWSKADPQPVRTGSSGFLRGLSSSSSSSIHVYSRNLSIPPSPSSLIGPQSCCELSPAPEKLNELGKFPSINCGKTFAACATFLWWEKQMQRNIISFSLTQFVLQYFAVFCSVLQYFALFCIILQYFAVFCSNLQRNIILSDTIRCYLWRHPNKKDQCKNAESFRNSQNVHSLVSNVGKL